MGGKITEILGFKSPLLKDKNFLFFFLFIFKFYTHNWVFLIPCLVGGYAVFYGEFENEKKKKDKKILTSGAEI